VPGIGKSAFAKALGSETGRPTLILDIGSLMGSLVGSTEQNIRQALKIVDAMAPCVCFLDEVEKALSGVNGSGDSGVSAQLFGTFLSWLNDHESDVFTIATCNDISNLPPEFSRAERFGDGGGVTHEAWQQITPSRLRHHLLWNRLFKQIDGCQHVAIGIVELDDPDAHQPHRHQPVHSITTGHALASVDPYCLF